MKGFILIKVDLIQPPFQPAFSTSPDRYTVVISDCHLSAGRMFQGQLNPHEDFYFDEEMVEMFDYFSTGKYGDGVEVELFINGDFFDFLNVPYKGEFSEEITEELAAYKAETIIKGHPEVMAALKRFASKPEKRITYLMGNHDADLFFEKVRKIITEAWDPNGQYPSEKVKIIAHTDRVKYSEGVEIHHGNQYEAGNLFNFQIPTIMNSFLKAPVLNLPWGSIYILKIVNRLKWEREHLDKVRPIKAYVLIGLLIDPLFTLKFCFLSGFYFFMTRFVWSPRRRARLKVTMEILKQESKVFKDLEEEARALLTEKKEVMTVVFGHTHRPMNKVYADGKQYINTGTWTKMINLDWSGMSSSFKRTFALLHFKDGKAHCELRYWLGEHSVHKPYAD